MAYIYLKIFICDFANVKKKQVMQKLTLAQRRAIEKLFSEWQRAGGWYNCAVISELKLSAELKKILDPDLMQKVAAAALASDRALDMRQWHTGATTHCIAGWGIHLHKHGYEIQKITHSGHFTGAFLLGAEASRYFTVSERVAKKYLKQFITKP